MSLKTKARLLFLAMFLVMFACGALAGRLGMRLGLSTLLYRNALAIVCSYVSFLLMMWFYVRAVRGDRTFLSEAAAESVPTPVRSSRGGGWDFFGDWGLDAEGWMVLLAVLALVLLVGIWIGIEGPALLIDEASAAAIAAGLAGKTVFLPEPSWLRRVLGRTIWAALIYLIFSSIVMGYADVKCPGRPGLSSVVGECVMR